MAQKFICAAFRALSLYVVFVQPGPALGMFEVFGRTGPPTLGGPPFWTVTIPYKLTCQFERPRCLDYGANTDISKVE